MVNIVVNICGKHCGKHGGKHGGNLQVNKWVNIVCGSDLHSTIERVLVICMVSTMEVN